MPQNNSQEENAKYIEQLIAAKKNKLENTMGKLELINTELEESGFYVEPEVEQIQVQLSQQVETTTEPTPSERSINQKRLSKLQAIQMQLEQLDRELRKAQKVEDETASLRKTIEEYQGENSTLQQKLNEKEETIKKLTKQLEVIESLEQLMTKMRYQLKQTQEEALLFKDLASKTKGELEATKANSKSLENNLDTLQSQSTQLQEMLQKTQKELDQIQTKVESDLQPTIIQYKEKVKEQETKLELTDSLGKTIKHLHSMIDEIKGDNQKLRESVADERDHISGERLQAKDMFSKYQKIHAELVAIAVELMERNQLLPIIDKQLRDQTYGWAIECVLEDLKSGAISEKEMKRSLNTLPYPNLVAALKTIPNYQLQTNEDKNVTIAEILNEVERKPDEKRDNDFKADSLGLFRYLLQV